MRIIAGLIVFCLFAAVSPSFAEDVFDGTKPLLCASIEALDCDPGAPCERGTPEIMGAPQFLRIDFAKSEIAGPERTTKIRSMEKDDDQLVLQGYELGLGWTLALISDRAPRKVMPDEVEKRCTRFQRIEAQDDRAFAHPQNFVRPKQHTLVLLVLTVRGLLRRVAPSSPTNDRAGTPTRSSITRRAAGQCSTWDRTISLPW